MFIDSKDGELSYLVYGLVNEDKKIIYIGQTTNKLKVRVGQHLSTNQTVSKYISNNLDIQLKTIVLYHYKRKHKNITKLLEKKEDFYLKKYKKLGYLLINKAKIKKLNLI